METVFDRFVINNLTFLLDCTRTALSTDIEKNLLETKSIKFLEFVNFELHVSLSSYRQKVQFS